MQLHVGLKTCNQTDSCCRIFYEQTWRLRIFKTYYNNSLWHSSKIKKDVISSVQIVVNATALISGQYFQLVIKYIRLFTVFFFFNLKLTLTSGQEAEVKSQSGHLKVFASKCALLWFSMSERPWKDSMHIRQENLLVFKLGELTVEGEAGVSLLSWWKIGTVRERIDLVF